MFRTTHHDTTAPSGWQQLAHGVSHDAANVVGAAHLAAETLRQSGPDPLVLDTLTDSLARMQAFLGRIRGWAQGDSGTPHSVDLADWAPALLRDLQHLGTPLHTVHTRHEGGLGTVYLDANRYASAARALVANAIESMPEGGRVRVHLEAEQHQLTLAVADEGQGFAFVPAAEAIPPYVTTKPGHKGLGLTDVAALARGYEGHLEITPTDQGTTVHLCLPVDSRDVKEPEGAKCRKAGGSDVLFVDDEPTLLRVAVHVLKRHGYRCHTASTAAAAQACFAEHHASIGLVVADYLLPDATGTELIHHFRQTHPDLPVILASGIAHHELHQYAAAGRIDAVLPKPYRSGDLLHAVQAVLPVAALAQTTI